MPPKKQVGKQTKVLTPSKLPSSSKQTTTKKPSTVVPKGKSGAAGKKTSTVTGAKKQVQSQASGSHATGKKSEVLKKDGWTKKDDMARKIQAIYRGYRCRKMLLDLKKKKAEYDELMEKLQREAFQKLCQLEREREEEEQKRQEEERRKKREATKRMQRMLEAAFDGDVPGIKEILSEVSSLYSEEQIVYIQQYKLVECTDPNGNTPVSEAAAGGDPDTIRFLLDLGADPNRKGQYGRTPLYRAAFCGHLEAVKVLLEIGADPRIHADDGAVPQQVAANASLTEFFEQWDIETTESMLRKLEEKFAERLQVEKKFQATEESKIQARLNKAEIEYSSKQKQLSKAYEELNKRIYEHDKHGHIKGEITLQAVHDAEDVLEIAKLQAEEARKKLQKIRLEQRVMRKNFQDDDSSVENEQVDVVINIRELDDVLMRDVGNKIADSGKWPLIIDPGEQAATFLRYRDTNYLNSCNPRHMEPETVRMAILGAIRYGKFVVLDLLDIEDMWPVVQHKFDVVQKDLLSNLMSKQLLKEEKYLTLVKESDGEEYTPKMFIGARVHNFKFVIVTQLLVPPQELLDTCYSIKIHATK